MAPQTFEQYVVGETAMADAKQWLKGQEDCILTLWNGVPLAVTAPNFVFLKITETDPGLKGDTSGGGGKPATLETGAVVRVPLFVQIDETVKVDTRTGEYVSRAKVSTLRKTKERTFFAPFVKGADARTAAGGFFSLAFLCRPGELSRRAIELAEQ